MSQECEKWWCHEVTDDSYCDRHRCGHLSCAKKKKRDLRFCREHNKCFKLDCEALRHGCMGDVEVVSPFCFDHLVTCGRNDCFANIEDRAYATYCEEHTCKATEECLENAHYPSIFCRDHYCRIQGCDRVTDFGLKYCTAHRCLTDCCPRPSKRTENHDEVSGYCSHHACLADECPSPREDHRSYCIAHEVCGKTHW